MDHQNSQQLTIQQAISQAKKATKEGNTAVVVNLYNTVLQQQPNHPGHADNWKVTRVTDPTK